MVTLFAHESALARVVVRVRLSFEDLGPALLPEHEADSVIGTATVADATEAVHLLHHVDTALVVEAIVLDWRVEIRVGGLLGQVRLDASVVRSMLIPVFVRIRID